MLCESTTKTMSAVSNIHKNNGNLIVSTNTGTANLSSTTTVGTTVKQSKSLTSNNNNLNQAHTNHHNQQQQQQSYNNVHTQQQQQSTKLPTISTKLQAPHQHQRRSLIPSISLQQQHQQQQQQQQQQQTVTIPNSTVSTIAPALQSNQLQTVATIHQPSSQAQQNSVQTVAEAVSSTEATSTTATISNTLENSIARRNFYHLQTLKSGNNLKAPAHSIPPRYQPPPQPKSNTNHTTGILKNLNTQRLDSGSKSSYPSYFSSESSGTHLNNLKYPPDIPQLSGIFIPNTLKNLPNSTRYLQQRQQNNQQTQLQQRLRNVTQATSSLGSNGHSSQQHQTSEFCQQQQQQQQQQHQDMLKFVRKPEQDHPSPNASVTSSGAGAVQPSANRLTAEQNRQLQSLINELRSLKEQNQRLMDDNQELRDLCCFLDDDRQKGRKLAREWQRFGRYTASVMRQEVAAYQNKLRQLDDKQQELITDNLELKELCLYLDEERAHIAANSLCVNCGASTRNALRDDGDGSSSSTNADENMAALRNFESQLPELHLRSTLQDQTLQYVRSLERRIQQLEKERSDFSTITTPAPTSNILNSQQHHLQQQQQQRLHRETQQQSQLNSCVTSATTHSQKLAQQTSALTDSLTDPISGRPEAIVRALQVLEVREQLERDRLGNLTGQTIDQMDDGEKALVREMCNVVWRKLEGSPNGSTALETL